MTVVAIIIWAKNHCDVCDHATVLVLIYNIVCLPFNTAVALLAYFTLKYPARMKRCFIAKQLCLRMPKYVPSLSTVYIWHVVIVV